MAGNFYPYIYTDIILEGGGGLTRILTKVPVLELILSLHLLGPPAGVQAGRGTSQGGVQCQTLILGNIYRLYILSKAARGFCFITFLTECVYI